MKQLELTRMEKAQHRIMAILYWFADAIPKQKRKEFYQEMIKSIKKEMKK